MMCYNLGQTGRAREYITKAFNMRGRASEWEKLDFAADYYSLVTGELQKADQIWQEYRENYPRDPLPLTNLTGNRQVEGDYASALELNHALLLLTRRPGQLQKASHLRFYGLGSHDARATG